MSHGPKETQSYIEGVHRFFFDAGYEVCRIECSSFYSRQAQNFCGGSKEVDFMLYHPGKRELWLIEVKDYRFDAKPKVRELFHILCRKVKDSLFLLRTAAMCSPVEDPLEGTGLREFARMSSDAVTIRLGFLLELSSSKLFPEGSMMSNIKSLLLSEMRFIDENLVVAPITFPMKTGPWRTEPADGQVSRRVEERMLKKEDETKKRKPPFPPDRPDEEPPSQTRHEPDGGETSSLPLWKRRLIERSEGKSGNHSGRRK